MTRFFQVAGLLLMYATTGCAPTTTVMTWNVNWGGPGMDAAVAAIRDSRADLVCLQETTRPWEQKLRSELSSEYPHMLFKHHLFPAGGLAVLSKNPIHETAYLAPEGGWFPALIVLADTPAGLLQIAIVHLHPPMGKPGTPGEAFSVKAVRRGEIKSLLPHLQPARPTLLLGDFNEDENGLAMKHLLNLGYVDALSRFDPTSPTWRVGAGTRTTGTRTAQSRVDHLLASPDLECISAEVLDRGESDHLPLLVQLKQATH